MKKGKNPFTLAAYAANDNGNLLTRKVPTVKFFALPKPKLLKLYPFSKKGPQTAPYSGPDFYENDN